MSCVYCQKIGCGNVCRDCFPSCIKCGSKKIQGSINSISTEKHGEVVWCKNCRQILPVYYTTQDLPAEDLEEQEIKDFIGVKKEDLK